MMMMIQMMIVMMYDDNDNLNVVTSISTYDDQRFLTHYWAVGINNS